MAICCEAGCPEIATDHGRCAAHRKLVVGTGSRGSTRRQRQRRERILRRDKHTCFYCGGPATTEDHLVPVARGGSESDSNLVAACGPCNYAKGAKTVAEFRGVGGHPHAPGGETARGLPRNVRNAGKAGFPGA